MRSGDLNATLPQEDIPVLLTIFNRPDKTKAVMENLQLIKPSRLFVSADGPRREWPEDAEKCRLARLEATSVEWECDVKTRFIEDNIGCDQAVPSAIDWFFQHVDYGIILEDDCIIHPNFFPFCGELFERYSDDQRIMQISSFSPYAARQYRYDYHFSRVFRCSGGWGTWRSAWKHFTSDMHRYDNTDALTILKAYQLDYFESLMKYRALIAYNNASSITYIGGDFLKTWRADYLKLYWGHWDYQWNMACSAQNGLCIVPEKNLMLNIGFDEDATNTKRMVAVFDGIKVQPLRFPLRHPSFVYADNLPERSLERKIFRSLPLKNRCTYLLRRALGAALYFRDILP